MKRGWMPALAAVLLLAGCRGENGPEAAAPGGDLPEGEEETSSSTDENGGLEIVELGTDMPYTAPFTGLAMEEEPDMRPVLVTINNHPKARPQSGLSEADVVYEMLAEGDITRLLALYQSELPGQIGPVRSARDYFVDLAAAHGALYIAHGYSPEAQSMLASGVVDHLNGMQYDGSLFKRSADRVAPHNSYISGEAILSGAEKNGFRMDEAPDPGWRFDEEAPMTVGTAGSFDVSYGSDKSYQSSYLYDPFSRTYTRSSGGVQTKDADDSEPVSVSNVLVLEMPHRVVDDQGRRSIDLEAGGAACVFRDGLLYETVWENRGGVPTVMGGGRPFPLAPGKTWVHFVPETPGIGTSISYTK